MTLKAFIRWAMIPIGAFAGFAYYHFVGCPDGTCMLSSNAPFMVIYGASLGYFIGAIIFPMQRRKAKTE